MESINKPIKDSYFNKMKSQAIYPFSLAVFLLNPFFGSFLLLNYLFVVITKNNKKLYKVLAIFLAILLGLINTTKVPENDIIWHTQYFLKSGDFSLLGYLVFVGKDPFFYFFNYIFYYLSNGNVRLWMLTFSFISYILFFISLIKFSKKVNFSNSQLLLALALAAFFPQLFSLSAHLIRQFVASAIFIYFAIDKIFYENNKWWLVIIGLFTHSSVFILFPLVYLPFLGDFKKNKILNILILGLLLSYQLVARILLLIVGKLNILLTYVLTRAIGDTTFDLGGFQLMNFVLMFVMLGIAFYYYKNDKLSKSKENNSRKNITEFNKKHLQIRHFFAILLYLSVFILANIQQSELSNRLFFYLFFFFPFIFPLLFDYRIKGSKYINYAVSMFFIFFFIYRIANGTWTYLPLTDLFSNSIFAYFLN